MTKITQKSRPSGIPFTAGQLISQIRQLKEIKPRKEWAVLLKSTLLENKVPSRMTGAIYAQKISFMDAFRSLFFQKRLAYAFAVLMLFVMGVFGFTKLMPTEKIPPQTAALTEQTALKQNLVDLNNKIKDLAVATKKSGATTKDISNKVSALAKSLKNAPVKDSQTIKEIAKTLADVPGADLTSSLEVKDLYQTVVQNQIDDLKKTTLTDEQKKTLTEVEGLYNQGKYTDALEKILLINN